MAELHYLTLTDPHEPARPRHLAYLEWGDKNNPRVAICVHGLSRNARDFNALAEALSLHYRVICPDMAGRGKSSWLTAKADYAYPLYISDCIALLDHLKLEKIRWVGTSMGGIIGMMIAASQKQRISSLVLNDVGAIVSAGGLRRILGYVGVGSSFNSKDAAMATLRSVLTPFHLTSEEQWDYMFNATTVPLPGGRFALAYDPGINQPFRDAVSGKEGISDVDLTGAWKEVVCPALIIRGELSDILTRETAEAMRYRSHPTELVEIKDTGHAPALIDPLQITTILDWLLKHDE